MISIASHLSKNNSKCEEYFYVTCLHAEYPTKNTAHTRVYIYLDVLIDTPLNINEIAEDLDMTKTAVISTLHELRLNNNITLHKANKNHLSLSPIR